MSTEQYGNFCWCIKVPATIAPDYEISVMADNAVVNSSGDAEFYQITSEGKRINNLVLATGQWVAFFRVSILDGSALAVERWEGEVER